MLAYASTPKPSIYPPGKLDLKFGLPDDLDWTDFSIGQHVCYRVKAKGGFAFLDSPWSEVVKVDRPLATVLDAPVLEREGSGFKWTSVNGASSYLLQMSQDLSFDKPVEVYAGAGSQWPVVSLLSSLATPRYKSPALARLEILPCNCRTRYYRVKANGGLAFLDSPWSNVVKVPLV